MIWHLAKRNISRNWAQCLLGIIGVAVAAAVMTASLSLQSGYPEDAAQPYRVFMGADLVVYPGTVGVDYERLPRDRESWQWSLRKDKDLSDLWVFNPDLYREGYLHPPGDPVSFDADELPAELQPTKRPPQVKQVNPLLRMPVQLLLEGETHSAGLRGRDTDVDMQQWSRWNLDEYLKRGRWLEPRDEGELVAMAYGRKPGTPVIEGVRPSYGVLGVDDEVTIRVPRLVKYSDDIPIWDWQQTKEFDLIIVGTFALPTDVHREDAARAGEFPEHSGELIITQHYLETDDIFIPAETWRQIFDEIAPSDTRLRSYQMNVILQDIFTARNVSEQLAAEMPDSTVRTVPDMAMLGRAGRGQSVIPADVSTMVVLGSFFIAGMLLVANMYLMVMQRRKDMAVLKAVGMSPGQVMRLILLETTMFSALGGLIGFSLTRLAVTGVLSLSEVSSAEIALLTARTGGIVVGSSVLLALIFGLLPAYQAVRQTTMEVLREVEK